MNPAPLVDAEAADLGIVHEIRVAQLGSVLEPVAIRIRQQWIGHIRVQLSSVVQSVTIAIR